MSIHRATAASAVLLIGIAVTGVGAQAPAPGARFVVMGCIEREAKSPGAAASQAATYTITDKRGPKPTVYRLTDRKSTRLNSSHRT